MQRSTLGIANLAYCLTWPLEEAAQGQSNVTSNDDPRVMGETQVAELKLSLRPYIEQSKSAEDIVDVQLNTPLDEEEEGPENPEIKETTKSEPVADIESDYSFLPDKIPDLTEDEYLEIGDDGTPFNFLKSRDNQRLVKGSTSQKLPTASSPIYITVPIYINTAAGVPLQLSIGGQQVPLTPEKLLQPPIKEPVPSTNAKEVSPTSQFNRLLNHDDNISSLISSEQQKMSLRGSNRHRSNIRSKYGRRKLQQQIPAATEYRNIGAFSIYI